MSESEAVQEPQKIQHEFESCLGYCIVFSHSTLFGQSPCQPFWCHATLYDGEYHRCGKPYDRHELPSNQTESTGGTR